MRNRISYIYNVSKQQQLLHPLIDHTKSLLLRKSVLSIIDSLTKMPLLGTCIFAELYICSHCLLFFCIVTMLFIYGGNKDYYYYKLHSQISKAKCQSKFAIHEVTNCHKSKDSSKGLHWQCQYITILFLIREDGWTKQLA